MSVLVANQRACIRGVTIGNGIRAIHSHNIRVKIHEPLPGNARTQGAHAVRGVAGRTREAVVDVPGMFCETRVAHNIIQIMALSTECIGSVGAYIGSREQIADRRARSRSRADFVAPLQDVRPSGPMRPVWSGPAGLTVVIAAVAIAAENLHAHRATRSNAVQLQQIGSKTRLQKGAAPRMHYRMARQAGLRKLGKQVKRISRRHDAVWQVAINRSDGLARARPMTPQTVFILVQYRVDRCDAVRAADANGTRLRTTNRRRIRIARGRHGRMAVVAVRAGGMPVVVQNCRLRWIVLVFSGWKRMSNFIELAVNVGQLRRNIVPATMAVDAILLIGASQQPLSSRGVVRLVARTAGIASYSWIRPNIRTFGNRIG